MSFITQVTISIVLYFIIRVFNKSEKSLYISACFAGISYILIYLLSFQVITILPTIHFMVTGLSLLFLFIAFNEIIILERKMRKIKNGDFLNAELFPIEKNYKIVFKFLGIGLIFLSFALISGFGMQSVFTANLVFKAIFTFIAWIIYIITMVGIKLFNFPIKYATRSLFVAMWAVLAAYYMNSYITGS